MEPADELDRIRFGQAFHKEDPMPLKPGIQTSELLVTLMPTIASLLVPVVNLIAKSDLEVSPTATALTQIILGVAYIISRFKLKAK